MQNNESTSRGSDSAREWASSRAKRVGEEVQRLRKDLGLSAVQLADRTDRLGYPITRGAIAKIEGNHRAGKLDVAELLVLAAALEVPPLELLFPDLPFGEVEALPGVIERSVDAALWAVGGRGLAQFTDGDQIHADQLANLSRLSRSLELIDYEDQLERQQRQLRKADDEDREAWAKTIDETEKRITRLKVRLGLEEEPPLSEEEKRRRRERYERAQARIEAERDKRESPSDG